MTRSSSTLTLATFGVFAAMAGTGLVISIVGPTNPIPVHFDLAGTADGWADRSQVGIGLVLLAAIGLVLSIGMGRQADRQSDDPSRRRGLIVAQGVLLLSFSLVTILFAALALSANGGGLPKGILMAGLGIIFAAIGAFLGRVGPNPFVGVRTPWTFKSRLAWERSNRLAGRLFFFGGLAAVVAAPFVPQEAGLTMLGCGAVFAALWSVVESWRVWRTDPNPQPF